MNRLKFVTDKRQNQLSESVVWHYDTVKSGNFLSQEGVSGVDGIKTQQNHAKLEISASKSTFRSFHAVL